MRTKRPPADSVSEQSRYARGTILKIKPPAYYPLSDEERTFFDNVIDELPKAEWTPHKIDIACGIAQSLASLVDINRRIAKVGKSIRHPDGGWVQNPLIVARKGVWGEIAAVRRTLGLQADGRNINTGKRTKIGLEVERRARRAIEEDEDGLLAGSDECDLA